MSRVPTAGGSSAVRDRIDDRTTKTDRKARE
jgi:hypothetical protein